MEFYHCHMTKPINAVHLKTFYKQAVLPEKLHDKSV